MSAVTMPCSAARRLSVGQTSVLVKTTRLGRSTWSASRMVPGASHGRYPATSAGMRAAKASADGEKWVKTTSTSPRSCRSASITARACNPSPTDGACTQMRRPSSDSRSREATRWRSAWPCPRIPRTSFESGDPSHGATRGAMACTPEKVRPWRDSMKPIGVKLPPRTCRRKAG